jgi:hypothetical protein
MQVALPASSVLPLLPLAVAVGAHVNEVEFSFGGGVDERLDVVPLSASADGDCRSAKGDFSERALQRKGTSAKGHFSERALRLKETFGEWTMELTTINGERK